MALIQRQSWRKYTSAQQRKRPSHTTMPESSTTGSREIASMSTSFQCAGLRRGARAFAGALTVSDAAGRATRFGGGGASWSESVSKWIGWSAVPSVGAFVARVVRRRTLSVMLLRVSSDSCTSRFRFGSITDWRVEMNDDGGWFRGDERVGSRGAGRSAMRTFWLRTGVSGIRSLRGCHPSDGAVDAGSCPLLRLLMLLLLLVTTGALLNSSAPVVAFMRIGRRLGDAADLIAAALLETPMIFVRNDDASFGGRYYQSHARRRQSY